MTVIYRHKSLTDANQAQAGKPLDAHCLLKWVWSLIQEVRLLHFISLYSIIAHTIHLNAGLL